MLLIIMNISIRSMLCLLMFNISKSPGRKGNLLLLQRESSKFYPKDNNVKLWFTVGLIISICLYKISLQNPNIIFLYTNIGYSNVDQFCWPNSIFVIKGNIVLQMILFEHLNKLWVWFFTFRYKYQYLIGQLFSY